SIEPGHHVRPVHLDGSRSWLDILCDTLVRFPFEQPFEHVALARREAGNELTSLGLALFEPCKLFAMTAQAVDRAIERLRREWPIEVVERTRQHRAHYPLRGRILGIERNRKVPVLGSDRFERFPGVRRLLVRDQQSAVRRRAAHQLIDALVDLRVNGLGIKFAGDLCSPGAIWIDHMDIVTYDHLLTPVWHLSGCLVRSNRYLVLAFSDSYLRMITRGISENT